MTGTGVQREQDRPAPCLQEASILIRETVHPQETSTSLISGNESAMEKIHSFTGDRVSGGAEVLEGKRSGEGLSEKVAFELWMTVWHLFSSACSAHFKSFLLAFWRCRRACGILVPQSWIKPVPPELETWSYKHGTAREVLTCSINVMVKH